MWRGGGEVLRFPIAVSPANRKPKLDSSYRMRMQAARISPARSTLPIYKKGMNMLRM